MTETAIIQNLQKEMNKKIAQLTKVVYVLNSKSSSMSNDLKDVSDEYEQEIKDILSKSAEKIADFKRTIDNTNIEANLQDIVIKLTDHHEKEKTKFIRDFEAFKSYTQEQEQVNRQKATEKMVNLQEKYETLTKTFEKRINQFEESLNAQTTQKKIELDALKLRLEDKFKRELETHVQESNQKYNSMLKENLAKQVELEELLQSEKERWTNLYEAKEKELINKYETIIHSLKMEQANANGSNAEVISELNENLQSKIEAVKKLSELITDKDVRIAMLSNDLREIVEQKKTVDDRSVGLEGQLNVLQGKSLQIEGENELLKAKGKVLEEELEDIRSMLKESKEHEEELLLELNNVQNGASSSMEAQQKIITQYKEKIKELEEKYGETVEILEKERIAWEKNKEIWDLKRKEMIEQLSDSQVFIKEKDQEINGLKLLLQQSNGQLNDLGDVKSGLNLQLNEATKKIDQLENQIENLKKLHREELQGNSKASEDEMNKMKASFEEQISKIQQKNDSFRQTIEKIQNVKGVLENEISALNTQLKDLLNTKQVLEEVNLSLKGEIDILHKSNENRAAMSLDEVKELALSLESKANELVESEKKILSLDSMNQELETKINELSYKLEQETKDRLEILNEKRKLEQEYYEMSVNGTTLSNEMTGRIKDLEAKSIDTIKNYEAQLKNQEQQYRTIVQQKNAQERDFVSQLEHKDRDIESLQSQLINQENDGLSSLQGIRQQHISEIARLNEEFEQIKQEILSKHELFVVNLKKEHDDDIFALNEENELKIKKLTEELKKKHENELQLQNNEHKRTVNLLKVEQSDRIQNITEKHGVDEKKLRKSLEENYFERERLQKLNYETEYSNLLDSLNQKTSELFAALKNVDMLELRIKDLQQDMIDGEKRLESCLEEQKKEHAAEIIGKNKEFNLKEIELNKLHEIELNELNDQFVEASNQMEERCRQFEEIAEEWKTKYLQRSSKPEDLQKISELIRLLEERDKELFQTKEDMKHFQLELINRDESYTKIFGRQPNAGIVDPRAVLNSKTPQRRVISGGNMSSKGNLGGLSIGGTGTSSNFPIITKNPSRKSSIGSTSGNNSRITRSNSSSSIRTRKSSSSQ
eukprot:TRINITY_DN2850_c0_g1_i2.p1 TRINITY_DN2850_c0_g1~~TRINITY_DN2850_c0_g1_i2.p1  ORF type:complete len:1110 (-),score=372.48 TRINITY_DN2850_c0_g1_i2:1438-4767(-)